MWSVWLVFCDSGFHKTPNGRDWLREKLGLVLMGGAVLSKSLIQFSVDGRGCIPSLLFDQRPNYGGGNKDNGNLLQNVPCMHCPTKCPWPCSRKLPTHAFARESWSLTGRSGSVSCGVTAPEHEWANLTQMTIISTTIGKNPLEEME